MGVPMVALTGRRHANKDGAAPANRAELGPPQEHSRPLQGTVMTKGILAFGAYIPWRRLPRKAIAETHGWFNPALKGQAKGERAFCNWDEDPVTMAVEAARDALTGRDRGTLAALRFA